MKIAKSLIGIAVIALVAGCATSGNEKLKDHTQSSISQQITEGKTTKSQVTSALGQPVSVSFTMAEMRYGLTGMLEQRHKRETLSRLPVWFPALQT